LYSALRILRNIQRPWPVSLSLDNLCRFNGDVAEVPLSKDPTKKH